MTKNTQLRLRVAASLATTALLVTACGNGAEDTTSSGKGTTAATVPSAATMHKPWADMESRYAGPWDGRLGRSSVAVVSGTVTGIEPADPLTDADTADLPRLHFATISVKVDKVHQGTLDTDTIQLYEQYVHLEDLTKALPTGLEVGLFLEDLSESAPKELDRAKTFRVGPAGLVVQTPEGVTYPKDGRVVQGTLDGALALPKE